MFGSAELDLDIMSTFHPAGARSRVNGVGYMIPMIENNINKLT